MPSQTECCKTETIPSRLLRFALNPTRSAEVVIWILLIAAIIGVRMYLVHLLPVAIWSKDANSYAHSAFVWVHGGAWETDPRRGAIYSLLIAFCTKLWGNIESLMLVQHALGAVAVFLGILALRLLHGRRALLPIAACGYAYAVYGLPISLEHVVRNETLLFFFGTLAFVSWLLAIQRNQPHWLWICGISIGLGTLTKNVFVPIPLVLIAGHLWYYRQSPRLAVKQVVIFVIALVIPFLGEKTLKTMTIHERPPEPQSGILLYGRTAQFTFLDGGIEPAIKQEIRVDVENYRKQVYGDGTKPPRLDNNVVIKRTIVPHLQRILYDRQHKTPAELDKFCRALAIEAIRTHPREYAMQIWRDLVTLQIHLGSRVQAPTQNDLNDLKGLLRHHETFDPLMHVEDTLNALEARTHRKHFSTYLHTLNSAWLFRLAPVLLTTLLLPLLVVRARPPLRLWWLGTAAAWYFTVVLLCTVGRPLERYILPVLPVMFWTLGSIVVLGFDRLRQLVEKQKPVQSTNSL